jgi:hypothetical protein
MEIETMFSKYDLDIDQVLNLKEQAALRRDIKKAKSHLEEKFQKEENEDKDENEETTEYPKNKIIYHLFSIF